MTRITKYILTAAILLGFVGISTGIYLYNKPHLDMASRQADISFAASKFFAEFEADENAANEKYLNKIIEVSGKVQEVTETEAGGLVLVLRGDDEMFGINCSFELENSKIVEGILPGEKISIRGLCTGMLMDVNLSRCVLVE